MKKTIESLYYGNITPSERTIRTNSKTAEVLHEADKTSEALCEKLNDEEKALFEDYQNKSGIANCELEFSAFLEGFRLAGNLLIEILTQGDDETE